MDRRRCLIAHRRSVLLLAGLAGCVFLASGCSRSQYRLAADREAYGAIAERNGDPRWQQPDYRVEIDPRSRYFDPYKPDCPPMPQDDPASHRYMRQVNGMSGWPHWYDNGIRPQLENPTWQQVLGEYVALDEDGNVKLDLPTALELAYVHSPDHQSQLETLYLSALDVTRERFELDCQYFGGFDLTYAYTSGFNDPLAVGNEGWFLNPDLSMNRTYATAGSLLVSFANSFVLGTSSARVSLLNFVFSQPLLRGGGRDVALESLTFIERALLANLRAYSQFRQGFYTQVAVGEVGVGRPQRGGPGTSIQVFSGQGFLGGYVGLLQQLQQIRNSEDNLNLQLRTLARLEALLEAGLIDLVQVDQSRQSVERQRADLLQSRNDYLQSLDRYKTNTLGLPPDLPIAVDDELIRQFQFVDRQAIAVQDSITALQDRMGLLPQDAAPEEIRAIQDDAFPLVQSLREQLDATAAEFERMKQVLPTRTQVLDQSEAEKLNKEILQLEDAAADLEQQYAEVQAGIEKLREMPDENSRRDTVILLRNMLRVVQLSILVQARSRLEAVTVESINLDPRDAFDIALENRLDFMNGRAALVDSWRAIQVNANALQSALDLQASGDVGSTTSDFAVGFRFDAPLTRLIERNNYREALINYQRERRAYIQSRDQLHLGLRVLLRQIDLLRTNLEIQRRAVAIAIRRVDLTRAALDQPVPPPQPGQRAAQFGPTAAINLVSAQAALQDTQNAFLGVWLNYYAAKMRLARELGIMTLDSEGRWIESPPPSSLEMEAQDIEATDSAEQTGENPDAPGELPPPLPEDLLGTVENLPEDFTFQAPADPAAVAGVPAAHKTLMNESALIE